MGYDEGETWPVARVVESGISGYSDLTVGPDGSIFCAFNRGSIDGNPFNKKYVCLARFNLAWLTPDDAQATVPA